MLFFECDYMIYLCFVEFYIECGVFHIAGCEPVRGTIGPRAPRAGTARKSAHVPCLGRLAGMVAWGGMARRAMRARVLPVYASMGPCHAGPYQPVAHLYIH
jgi:hypothetical protein